MKYDEKVGQFAAEKEHAKAAYWQRNAKEFMGQFLVNQLSTRGLIPTYSFPVHSLTLEVIREEGGRRFGYDQSEIALIRDASLGIAEYAPGSEVVANGRIWTSEALAQYPKQFMPDRWYVACLECFHVDIGDLPEEVPTACGNCGSSDGRRKRKFIEPKGFVTGYARRKGRDPGSSRRRVKPADEARLIVSPRDEQFEESGVTGMRTALLRASSSTDNEVRGAMFIANRGGYGEGYLRCPLCNYAAAKSPQNKPVKGKTGSKGKYSLVHDDPLTGRRCTNAEIGSTTVDLVHRFDTDVRLYRFVEPLPAPRQTETSIRAYSERVARTIAEAFRFAAADLLEVQSRSMRATYRLLRAGVSLPEIVLYDAVPGGAGYCAKLGSPEYAHALLLGRVRTRLDCVAGCTNGCRQCLCDYANQRYWDAFERVAALDWTRGILGESQKAAVPGNFQPWETPSLGALESRLANYGDIYVFGRRLVGNGAIDEPSLALLTRWLQAGKKVRLVICDGVERKPKSAGALEAYRFLHPYLVRGNLTIAQPSAEYRDQWISLPRIFAKPALGIPLIRDTSPVQPVLSGLISRTVEIGVCDQSLRGKLDSLLRKAVIQPPDLLKEGDRLELFDLKEGGRRKIANVFSALRGAHVKQIAIRDPYCGARTHRPKLQAFVIELMKLVKTIESVAIQCKEVRPGHDFEHRHHVTQQVESILKSLGMERHSVAVQEHSVSSRAFHDREVEVEVVNDNGTTVKHRYFLTGGIDYLMDERSSTKVFHYPLET